MPDLLIRGLSTEALRRIDDDATALGLSRNEFLRRQLEGTTAPRVDITCSAVDLRRAGDAVSDLLDDEIMERTWR